MLCSSSKDIQLHLPYAKNNANPALSVALLLETGSKGFDLKGHNVLDVKIGPASNYAPFWLKDW